MKQPPFRAIGDDIGCAPKAAPAPKPIIPRYHICTEKSGRIAGPFLLQEALSNGHDMLLKKLWWVEAQYDSETNKADPPKKVRLKSEPEPEPVP